MFVQHEQNPVAISISGILLIPDADTYPTSTIFVFEFLNNISCLHSFTINYLLYFLECGFPAIFHNYNIE